MFNRIREVFKRRPHRAHRRQRAAATSTTPARRGVLVEVEGGNDEAAKDVCHAHRGACSPQALAKEDLDPAVVEKEREILTEAARKEGKPDNIIDKMVEGRLRNFYAEHVLAEQPFVKDDKQTVGKYAAGATA